MRSEEFRAWMESSGKMGKRPISDAVSRCKRVTVCLDVDLDEEYSKDNGASLIEKLKYTYEDLRVGQPLPGKLVFKSGTNYKTSMDSLRSAVRKYMEFCRER